MIVIINEQHQLLFKQKEILDIMGDYLFYLVPSQGITKQEILAKSEELKNETVIFVSPIPLLLAKVVATNEREVYLFHNDYRQKKEENSEITTFLSDRNWELIKVK